MASYHLSVKPVSRSAGRSATAAAAYRAACRIECDREGKIHDYTRRSGVEHSEIVFPIGANALDRQSLWNTAEAAEKRKDARVAREFEIALPVELSAIQRKSLALQLAAEIAARHGCAVDVAIHTPGKGDDRNHHAHLLATSRRMEGQGLGAKCRELDDHKTGPVEVEYWRARWADIQNKALETAGFVARVEHKARTAEEIQLGREPTVHLGPDVSEIERRGISTERGDINRAVENRNTERQTLRQLILDEENRISLFTNTDRKVTADSFTATKPENRIMLPAQIDNSLNIIIPKNDIITDIQPKIILSSERPVMEIIKRREFRDEDRRLVQEQAIASVIRDPESHLAEYVKDPRSFNGRYVSADLFKETFPTFRESHQSRDRYNAAVHNSAAVLANEQYTRVLGLPRQAGQDSVMLITGVPGAGKTSYIMANGVLRPDAHMVYEGQLARPETTLPKIEKTLAADFKPLIVAVHPRPEWALDNANRRFTEIGRGASIGLMADIQGGLADGLAAVKAAHGEQVRLQVLDKRNPVEVKRLEGWGHLDVLRSEGGRDAIRERLQKHLDAGVLAGTVNEATRRQAVGQPAYDAGTVGRPGLDQHPAHEQRPPIPQGSRPTVVLTSPPPVAAPAAQKTPAEELALFEQMKASQRAERAKQLAVAAQKADAEEKQRIDLLNDQVKLEPKQPTGIAALLGKKSYERQFDQWREVALTMREDAQRAKALRHQIAAESTTEKITAWADAQIRATSPQLAARVDAYKAQQKRDALDQKNLVAWDTQAKILAKIARDASDRAKRREKLTTTGPATVELIKKYRALIATQISPPDAEYRLAKALAAEAQQSAQEGRNAVTAGAGGQKPAKSLIDRFAAELQAAQTKNQERDRGPDIER